MSIQVGATADASGGIFQFIPPMINATNGTIVNFQFTGMYALMISFPLSVLIGFIGLEITQLRSRHLAIHVILSMVDLIQVGSLSLMQACLLCLSSTSQLRMTPSVSSFPLLHQWIDDVPLQRSGSSVNSCRHHPTV